MDDEKQLMKYLSWLDDLDQDGIFRDTENLKMDQGDLSGQSNIDNTLQYDPNVANFDYSDRMMPYSVNEPIMTGAINTTQPNTVPDSFNYNNFLPNGGFYTDGSLNQQHIPMKPSEQPFCVDMDQTVHSENSYVNSSDPQLVIDISANASNLNVTQEPNQYALPNDVDIKNNFFNEEKHVMNADYANSQLSMNPIPHDVNATVNNDFSQISGPSELYCGNISQDSMDVDHTTVHENQFASTVQNLDEGSRPQPEVIEQPIVIKDDAQEVDAKPEPINEVKQECKQEEIDLNAEQEQTTVSAPVQSPTNTVKTEELTEQQRKVENENLNDSASNAVANGVDQVNIEDELNDIQMCIRDGCANRAINNPEWEQEFCSNECVIMHCRNVFTAWVKTNEITL
ncbi:uncharacterized protein LOC135840447 isoform X2 [Planococcus citri]|uniref:uncharacterized protein LOC135840447 isoform X2 n=1 Tax=Planococcus citri TaxID=170843 RepID=UPI0031F8745A